jgi:hypothetical protein
VEPVQTYEPAFSRGCGLVYSVEAFFEALAFFMFLTTLCACLTNAAGWASLNAYTTHLKSKLPQASGANAAEMDHEQLGGWR